MTTIQSLWQTIKTQYNNGTFPTDRLEKIDVLAFSEDIENIRNGLTLMTTSASEYLCRYLELDGESMVLRDAERFSAPLSAERVLVKSAKSDSLWQGLYESGAFESMELRALGHVLIENLSESEKGFCVRMAKTMVRIPAGEFMMGALEDDEQAIDFEKPRHKVTLTRVFMIGKHAVTQALWESVMGSNPSYFKGANRPVENVSWYDVVSFCNKLSEQEGLEPVYMINGENVTCNWNAKGYRLPTEAEWEYSARGGEYHKYAGSNIVDEVAWCEDNSGGWLDGETFPVGQKKPNGFGLYDMSGNVSEWCWDDWCDYSSASQTDPTGSDDEGACYMESRVCRSGNWGSIAEDTSVSFRINYDPKIRSDDRGFRLSRFTI